MGDATTGSGPVDPTTRVRKTSVFISYFHQDRGQVEPLVVALERRGFDVWWDQKIYAGDWAEQLETWLDRSNHVIAFLTESAANSGPVLAEVRRARNLGKLVPLRIGHYRMPLSCDGLICLVQTHTFETAAVVLEADGLERLCRACGSSDADTPRSIGWWQDAADHAGRSFDLRQSHALIAFTVSLAVLEHASLPQIQSASNDLARLLRSAVPEPANATAGERLPEAATAQWHDMLTPRSERLQAIGAEVYREPHPRLKVG